MSINVNLWMMFTILRMKCGLNENTYVENIFGMLVQQQPSYIESMKCALSASMRRAGQRESKRERVKSGTYLKKINVFRFSGWKNKRVQNITTQHKYRQEGVVQLFQVSFIAFYFIYENFVFHSQNILKRNEGKLDVATQRAPVSVLLNPFFTGKLG